VRQLTFYRMRPSVVRTLLSAAVAAGLPGCARAVGPLVQPGCSAVALTAGPNTSMVYLARLDGAVIAVDLGWWDAPRKVRRALGELDAAPAEVTHVFLTHSHRDHVGAWRLLRRSEFHLAQGERAAFTGERRHSGWGPRVVEALKATDLPRHGELDIRTFSRDTAYVFGPDTVYAYVVPGHTAGSAVYLVRGVLFLGDAATYTPWGGFAPAVPRHSDDPALAARSLHALWGRLPAGRVHYVCTAHARCAPFSPAFLRDVEH
jgi:hydroxyacylglutathione hydrolase